MTFLVIAFFSGILTVLAPCVLPLLPVIIGRSIIERRKFTPYIVVASLAISIVLFTLLLKTSSIAIKVSPQTWLYLSGGILILYGVTLLFPALWKQFPGLHTISSNSKTVLERGVRKKTWWGDVLVGASLGPIFSTCSPTYFVILASILPVSFALGVVYLIAYTLGLALILLPIALMGTELANRLQFFSNPEGWFKRSIGALFIVLGVMIALGLEKKLERSILERGYTGAASVEYKLLEIIE